MSAILSKAIFFFSDIVIDFFFLQSLSEIQGHSKDKANRNKKANSSTNVAAKVFSRYDVVETSYHFYSDRIDLHLCDDPGGSKCSFITSIPRLAPGYSLPQERIKSYSFGIDRL